MAKDFMKCTNKKGNMPTHKLMIFKHYHDGNDKPYDLSYLL